jgi:hypothetical protein
MKKTLLRAPNPNNPQIKKYNLAIKIGSKNQHVLPAKNGWAVKRASASHATQIFKKKQDAIMLATNTASKQFATVFIHGKDGLIQSRRSYAR